MHRATRRAALRLGTIFCSVLPMNVAVADTVRTTLPIPVPPFSGTIAERVTASKPAPQFRVTAPAGAPNVLVLMSDDVGFAMSSTFGGPVPTPNYDRLARTGQRYNRFHTTGICSPSRAALLTGRNHHNAGNGYLSDLPTGYPGYGGKILPETATLAQMLRLNGYSTAMFGKHHNTPGAERSEAGPFDSWPTGLGFDYFFGFISGDTDQYSPNLYRGTNRVHPGEGQGKIFERRMADDMIRWVHNQKAAAPDKPFFGYLSPGSAHAPHQAPAEVIVRFKGKFDQGWDKAREEIHRRQIAEGIIPKGTKLTPRPAAIPAWDSLNAGQKAYAARSMEVAAAMLAYQDEQVGRVLDELERMGELKNTLVMVIEGDNGGSGESGPRGSLNELRGISTHDEDQAWMEANTDRLGSEAAYGNYPVGWAWATNTPFRWAKQFASMLGGIRNGMIVSWPGKIAKPGSVCSEFSHLVDVAPTVMAAANLPFPETVYGTRQKAFDGQNLLSSLTRCEPARPRTQYFEIGGKMGLYSNGWFLSGDDGRPSWEMAQPAGTAPKVDWTLYNLDADFSQSADVAASQPAKFKEMMALWQAEAKRNNVFPIDGRRPMDRRDPADMGAVRKRFDYWGKDISLVATGSAPFLAGRSFTVEADLVLDKATASGAVLAVGSRFGGWSLYLDNGAPAFQWARSTDPKEMALVTASAPLPQGASKLQMKFISAGPGKTADVVLSANGREIARGTLPGNFLMPAGGGETMDIGRDIGVPVTDYRTPLGAIEGDVPHVAIMFD